MNYTLELNTQEPDSNIVFNTIVFDSFKINIVERYIRSIKSQPKLCEALFKVRTLDDVLIKTREDNGRIKIKGDQFETYQRLRRGLSSYEYKNKLINRKEVEENYVHFILSLVIANYNLS
ncbi:prevent-host-death protein [Chryseobacterium sp. Tr-659]|uniref:prevent-host-death protein n=1 Tax=Chryseobacterium sp. Tr-659 TaxID=2608340 RepID=UPI00141DE982|nr:prevent-host-death protein [Chryseobacterium sp. Tr-659]NIF04772.1 prevent-host-death protein [Chryseobacterium sp. Tr-659]